MAHGVQSGAQLAISGIARLRRAPPSVVALELGLALVTLVLALPVELAAGRLLAGWLGSGSPPPRSRAGPRRGSPSSRCSFVYARREGRS